MTALSWNSPIRGATGSRANRSGFCRRPERGQVDRIAAAPRLGEDHVFATPPLLRARLDRLPQLGAAALPLHDLLEPVPYPTQARKGW